MKRQTLAAPHMLQTFALIIRATHANGRADQREALAELHRRGSWLSHGLQGGDDQEAMAIRAAGLEPPPADARGDRAAILKAMGYRRAARPMEAREALPVIFRADRAGDFKGDVTAVFPTLPGTSAPYTATCYAHVGQHGSCSPDWYRQTRAAKPDEFAPLLAELRSIYERADDPEAVRLVIVKRWTRHHDATRRAALARMAA